MIKIKLTNWNKGRNNHTFRPFLMYGLQFEQIGVRFVQDGSYDFEFIGMEDFLNKKIPLQDSIKFGIESLSTKNGDYFLFDGSDSTSIMAAYEVFEKSNAKYLFKTAKTTQEQYAKPSAFNKWFFGPGSELDLSYNIPNDVYNRIKLTGWNFGHYNPDYLNFDNSNLERNIDVCAIYQGFHKENGDHGVRNDLMYTNHRTLAWKMLENSKGIIYEKDKRPFPEFADVMRRSKCTLSPYGMGELCFRDFEIIQYGSVMIKPDMSKVITHPNIYVPYETYIPCALDWSDLIEKIEWVKSNPKQCKEIVENAKQIVKKAYKIENLLLYWYNILSNLDNVTHEDSLDIR
tara:strand:+ start:75 stop:1109 length:1035 start_codon:yes stop_codon:yes gene_type:complete